VRGFLLKRGLLLVVLELTVVNFAWSGEFPPTVLWLQVIWAIGLSMIDGVSKMAPQFSLADAARFLNEKLGDEDAIVYEGALDAGSSLLFYLPRRFYLVNEPPDDEMHTAAHNRNISVNEEDVLREWGRPKGVYLIVEQGRESYWQKLLTARFHIYHEVAACGRYVILSNQL